MKSGQTDKPTLVKLEEFPAQMISCETKISTIMKQAQAAKGQAEEASKISLLFWNKSKAIKSLRNTVKNLSEVQVGIVEAQKEVLECQNKIVDLYSDLFHICTSSLADNRAAYNRLAELLNGASQERLDDKQKSEIEAIMKRLNDGVDIFSRQDKLLRELEQVEQSLTEIKTTATRPKIISYISIGLSIFASLLVIIFIFALLKTGVLI